MFLTINSYRISKIIPVFIFHFCVKLFTFFSVNYGKKISFRKLIRKFAIQKVHYLCLINNNCLWNICSRIPIFLIYMPRKFGIFAERSLGKSC